MSARWVALVALAWGAATGACRDAERREAPERLRCIPGQFDVCERACEGGDDRACEQVTAMYLRGVGVEKSEEKATALTRRLCEGGRPYFCPSYAFALFVGSGVARDEARARKLFAETCRHDAKGCSEFGSLIATGTGVPRDLELGIELLEAACDLGDADACEDLRKLGSRR